jgi:hypothetical protein
VPSPPPVSPASFPGGSILLFLLLLRATVLPFPFRLSSFPCLSACLLSCRLALTVFLLVRLARFSSVRADHSTVISCFNSSLISCFSSFQFLAEGPFANPALHYAVSLYGSLSLLGFLLLFPRIFFLFRK